MEITRIIIRPHVTEKTYQLRESEKQVLSFVVDKKANKHQIKEAFIAIFGQKPEKISTVLRKPTVINKNRPNQGFTKAKKIAYVTMPKGVKVGQSEDPTDTK
ncbi:50S ribosomal protein L23 [Ureaplasma diversum]|uniref:50S ribosomal protein L23 n=2 Tax=Ureaplasma diversum TaxID=42094 RepID=A0A084F1R5_9BACT|nr:50S ribosomal protein L23 [Ureaplasma diversum]AJQ45599.1 50S ribosomal protein L23 [Ureaplasma diversum]KEZ24157.1 50S ribosomal protein L23 [Ureaplasma diversum NCTC 246]